MGIQWYRQDCASLLWDYSLAFTPQKQLDRWINEARRQVAYHTGCVRRHLTGQSAFGASSQPGAFIPGGAQPGSTAPNSNPDAQDFATVGDFQAIAGVERYPFQGFANPKLKAQHAGCEGIIDVGQVAVSWGGSPMPSLAWLPWEDLQAYARAYQNLVTSYPYYWSVLADGGDGEVWLFPVPSTGGPIANMEWDVFCYPSTLHSDNDFDAIPEGQRNAVKFGAVALALTGKQRYADANYMDGQFHERMGTANVARDRGKIPNFYYQVP